MNLISFKKKRTDSGKYEEINQTFSESKVDHTLLSQKLNVVVSDADHITNSVDKLKTSVDEIAAVVEELSANTQETASTIMTINTNVADVSERVTYVAVQLIENMGVVGEISERATGLRDEAIESETNATKMCLDFNNTLKSAVGKAKVIDEIGLITNNILRVATQINLISLNASIEAARAGEHGKGFIVVAAEIKKLAEQTRKAVLSIQEIANHLNEFLSELIVSSTSMTEFMENQVIGDYKKLVEIGERYNSDATNINGMMEDFAATIDIISTSMSSISEGVSSIAKASGENAKGANEIACNLEELTEKSAGMLVSVNESMENLEELNRMI